MESQSFLTNFAYKFGVLVGFDFFLKKKILLIIFFLILSLWMFINFINNVYISVCNCLFNINQIFRFLWFLITDISILIIFSWISKIFYFSPKKYFFLSFGSDIFSVCFQREKNTNWKSCRATFFTNKRWMFHYTCSSEVFYVGCWVFATPLA